MARCPITYAICENGKYSQRGLRLLSRSLVELRDFPYSAAQQIGLAMQMNLKLSIQGVQPKLSVVLDVKKETFEIVEQGGLFIVKPPHHIYDEVPQNEDLSMKLAALVGIEVPLHGMFYNSDGSLSYFIKRFDRKGRHKIGTEDFSQLMGGSREVKYDSSMEKVVAILEKHCTFPVFEKLKLFRRVIFNFLIGNEDMHLKNYSLIRNKENEALSPGYDFLNTTLIMNAKEEIALPLRGKKSNLNREDFLTYYAQERLGLPEQAIKEELLIFEKALPLWQKWIGMSLLSVPKQEKYWALVLDRARRLHLRATP